MADTTTTIPSSTSTTTEQKSINQQGTDTSLPSVAPSLPSSSSSSIPTSTASSSSTAIPSLTTTTATAPVAKDNVLKRSHPEYDDKTSEELVAEEKNKIQKIHTLVNEVQQGTDDIDAKIASARGSTDISERNGIITDIKLAAAELQDKVINAAELESDVVEINTVLKQKKAAEEKADAAVDSAYLRSSSKPVQDSKQ